jgi:hypothetical protein
MKTYVVPAHYTISGHIEISADNLFDAKKKAEKMNEEGFDPEKILDPDFHSVVYLNDIEMPAEEM